MDERQTGSLAYGDLSRNLCLRRADNMSHIGCKHLDYESNYRDCELKTIEPEGWKYWERGPSWTEGKGNEGNPKKVQFCGAGRGRINGIFQCINVGEMSCYEPQGEKS